MAMFSRYKKNQTNMKTKTKTKTKTNCKSYKNYMNQKKTKTKTKKILQGGQTFSTNGEVALHYKGRGVPCDVCKSNRYTETTGAFSKSKVRSIFFSFLGNASLLDTTSVIVYTCNECGLCKVVRNNSVNQIKATAISAS